MAPHPTNAAAAAPTAASAAELPVPVARRGRRTGVLAQLEEAIGDAPACSTCGHITVRNGTCYKCLNCGSSMGCS
jgi:ribonucleoside-diphosphate reductase alpha chain